MYRVVVDSVVWATGGYKPQPNVRHGLAGAHGYAPNPRQSEVLFGLAALCMHCKRGRM